MFPRFSHDRLTERLSAGEPAASYPEPEFRLAVAILARAALDWRRWRGASHWKARRPAQNEDDWNWGGFARPEDELRAFFQSGWFECLADGAGVDVEAARAGLLGNG